MDEPYFDYIFSADNDSKSVNAFVNNEKERYTADLGPNMQHKKGCESVTHSPSILK